MAPLKKNKKTSTRRKTAAKKAAPQKKAPVKPKLWKWVGFLTAPTKTKKPDNKLIKIRKRGLTKREIGKKGSRKIDITIIGLVAIIGIFLSYSSFQDYFKASILSLGQKNAVVNSAKSRIGIGYRIGGTGPDAYDCSGLTSTVVKEALGVNLPRTSRDQYTVGRDIAFANLGVGDLVFFKTAGGETISHVGIITDISGGKIKMTHANSYVGKVQEEDIKNSTYWQQTYVGAREITEATKDLVAPEVPDPTYQAPKTTKTDDEYNHYFPPSERVDPRLKVGAATIEPTTSGTKVITDTEIRATTKPTPRASTTPTTSATPTATITSLPTATALITHTPTTTTRPSATATTKPIETNKSFNDVSNDYYAYNAIQKLSTLGIINGYSDGTFRPDAPVTRAELTKMVYGALKKTPKVMTTNPFNDIDTTNGLSKYVLSAYRDGLVKGYKDFTFRPQNSVTKAEGSKIILKAFQLTPEKVKQTVDDMTSLGDLRDYVGYMINHQLLPVIDSLVRANAPLTRAQTAYILASLLNQ